MRPNNIKRLDWILYNLFFLLEHFLGQKIYFNYFKKYQTRLNNRIDKKLNCSDNIHDQNVIEVTNDISFKEFYNKYYKNRQPVVFRKIAKNWGAVQKWNLDFFQENYGNEEIILNDNVGLANQEFEILKFKDYIEQLKNGSLKYLRFSDIVSRNEELMNDFDLAWLRKYNLPYSWGEDVKMFMGIKGTLTPLHVGYSDFLFVQVMGKKKWILYPTNHRILLDARTQRTLHFYSNANPYVLDDPNFPLLKYAEMKSVVLEPGDILWVPSLYWHHVENESNSIGIRFGRSSLSSGLSASSVLTTLLFIFSTKPNLFVQAIFKRFEKKDLHFSQSRKK